MGEIELHQKQLSRTVQKQPSGAIHLQKFLLETPVVESFLWSNYRLTVQSSNNITKTTLPGIFRNHSKHLNIIDCIWSLEVFEVSPFLKGKVTFCRCRTYVYLQIFPGIKFFLVSRTFLAQDNVLSSIKKDIVHQKSCFTAMKI